MINNKRSLEHKKKNNKTSFRKKNKHNKKEIPFDNRVRLNKFIAKSGICSRREADKFIKAGVVQVNGVGVTEMGYKVSPTDVVKFNGTKIKAEELRYVLLNKPKNFSSRLSNQNKLYSVNRLIEKACKEYIYPIDKLNKMDTGLLLFTNDIDLSTKLVKKAKRVKSIFQVLLNNNLNQNDLERIRSGVIIDGDKYILDKISYLQGKEKNELGIESSKGGVKLIKQLFKNVGYKVVKLDRVFFAGLTKKDLPRKYYRHLSSSEINILKRI